MKLAILATHPVQYQIPLFRELHNKEGVDLTVFYCHKPSDKEQGAGFGVSFQWDIDLLSGYNYEWLENVSKKPDLMTFRGLDTPDISTRIKEENFDTVIVFGWHRKCYWQAVWASWKNRTPVYMRGDSQLDPSLVWWKKIFKKLVYPLILRRFDGCIPFGIRSKEYFEEYGGRNIQISSHVVDNSWFEKSAHDSAGTRNKRRIEWGFSDKDTIFLFAGKFEPKKRPMDAIRAVGELNQKGLNVGLVMVGDGELLENCKAYASEHRSPVVFLGFKNQTEMPETYVAADCILLCSDYRETWGLVVNEAMACGLPAIVSESCGCAPDLINENLSGATYSCGDLERLIELMEVYVKDYPENITEEVKKHISKFDINVAANQLLHAVSCPVGR